MTDDTETTKAKREISSIAFPYLDIDDAMVVARAILDRGAVPLERDQLAAALGNLPTSGAFAIKLSTARMFGLIEGVQGKSQLTPLGFEILDAAREAAAKAEAFLNVPLFRKVFDEFKGRQLPPRPAGLEQAFVGFGVSAKQKDRARQVFDRSARSAGFFITPAEDRLVQPVVAHSGLPAVASSVSPIPMPMEMPGAPPADWRQVYDAVPVDTRRPALHPFISGLLETLPETKGDWSLSDRAKWLQAAAQIFDLLYSSAGEGAVVVTVRKSEP